MSKAGHPRTEMVGPVHDPADGVYYVFLRGVIYVTRDRSAWTRVSLDNETEVRRAVNLLDISYLDLVIPPSA